MRGRRHTSRLSSPSGVHTEYLREREREREIKREREKSINGEMNNTHFR
jgi:hypothetical protein